MAIELPTLIVCPRDAAVVLAVSFPFRIGVDAIIDERQVVLKLVIPPAEELPGPPEERRVSSQPVQPRSRHEGEGVLYCIFADV